MSCNCIYILALTFISSFTIYNKLLSKTQNWFSNEQQWQGKKLLFFVNTVMEYIPGARRPGSNQEAADEPGLHLNLIPLRRPFNSSRTWKQGAHDWSWFDLQWKQPAGVWSVHKGPDILWRLTSLLISGLRVCEWRRLALKSKPKERHFQRQQLAAVMGCKEQKCLQFFSIVLRVWECSRLLGRAC